MAEVDLDHTDSYGYRYTAGNPASRTKDHRPVRRTLWAIEENQVRVDHTTAGSEGAHCALTVRLTFADRVDADDAIDTMENCITDALSFEPSIEDVPAVDEDKPASETARYALTARLRFTDRVDADDAVDRMEHCILKALSFEPAIEEV
ncbi:MAG TPA: hypothetical protein VFR27_02075 [Mycobacterium sp.]|nr:hypothetical protein [Mycobacterium sp.]